MRTLTIIFILSLVFPQICLATEYPKKEEPNYLLDFSLVAAGILTQYPLTHELGHWFGGRLVGKNVEFSSSNIGGGKIGENVSDEDVNIIGSSGFVFPMIVSEIALDTPLPKGNPYVMGLVLGPLIHNISYIIQDSTKIKDDKYNDFHAMAEAGLGREITYPVVLIIPAIQAWRLISNKDFKSRWGFWMGASEKGISLAMNCKF